MSDTPSLGESGWHEAGFWASSRCGSTRSPAPTETPEPGSSVLVGPPESGKTSFLTSLVRAFESGRSPEWARFVPGRSLTRLLRTTPSDPVGEAGTLSFASLSASTYRFQLGFRSLELATGAGETIEEVEVSVLDTPGTFFEALSGYGSQLDEPRTRDLVRAARNACCLVLCVRTDRKVDGKVNVVGAVDSLLCAGPRRLRCVGSGPWPAGESPWGRASRLELPFERVLVLVTGIDVLCEAAARALTDVEEEWLAASPQEIRDAAVLRGLAPWQIAEMLDPVPLAHELVAGLDVLASSLRPGARVAICGASTTGIEPSFPHDLIRSRSSASESHFRTSQAGRTTPLAPFGVWASLLFMTTGRVVAPLTVLDPDSLEAPHRLTQSCEASQEAR